MESQVLDRALQTEVAKEDKMALAANLPESHSQS